MWLLVKYIGMSARPVYKKIFEDGWAPNARLLLTIKSRLDYSKTFKMLREREMEITGTAAEVKRLIHFIKEWEYKSRL
jgi:hypothetical protein